MSIETLREKVSKQRVRERARQGGHLAKVVITLGLGLHIKGLESDKIIDNFHQSVVRLNRVACRPDCSCKKLARALAQRG